MYAAVETDYLFIGGSLHGCVRSVREGNKFTNVSSGESWEVSTVSAAGVTVVVFARIDMSASQVQAAYYELRGRRVC